MEQKILVDTDILIKAYRGDESKMRNLALLKGKYVISVVTAIELIAGSKNIKQLASLKKVLKIYPTIHINEIISRQAYKLYQQHTLRQLIGLPDSVNVY